MTKRSIAVLVVIAGALALLAPAASAKTELLTLYSPRFMTQPYVHDTFDMTLAPNGRNAPSEPGYITGIKEQTLVDSKDPDAKPLPNDRFMIHHFLMFAPGHMDRAPASCWGPSGFIMGRGEEHPNGDFSSYTPPAARRKYGINNRLANGRAPTWFFTAMVMNHVRAPKPVYARIKVWYTTGEKRKSVMPMVVGKCAHVLNRMAYDVPGGGARGSVFKDTSRFQIPSSFKGGRIVLAASHQHGGGMYHKLRSVTCNRQLFHSNVYHGLPNHIYNTIRPILHEPGPIANGTFGSMEGVPIDGGEVLERTAVHDNANLHVASMGFWVLNVVADDSVDRCERMPRDVRILSRPRRWDTTPNYGLVVPQLRRPAGPEQTYNGGLLPIGDLFFTGERLRARVGERITWGFGGQKPHSVTVANGPRGFSSLYSGQRNGVYSFTPTVRGTYRLTCLIHPLSMSQTIRVQ